MLRERIIWIAALLIVAVAGFYSGNMIGTKAGQQAATQTAQQFYTQRGGGNGQAGAAGQGQNGGFAGRGVSGTVASIDGSTITVTTRNGQTQKVALASDAKVFKQASGQLSDITTGEQITAMGQANGDTFQASAIQIGGGFGGAGGRNGTNTNGQSTGTNAPQATPAP